MATFVIENFQQGRFVQRPDAMPQVAQRHLVVVRQW
jgi:hypothetical protein